MFLLLSLSFLNFPSLVGRHWAGAILKRQVEASPTVRPWNVGRVWVSRGVRRQTEEPFQKVPECPRGPFNPVTCDSGL